MGSVTSMIGRSSGLPSAWLARFFIVSAILLSSGMLSANWHIISTMRWEEIALTIYDQISANQIKEQSVMSTWLVRALSALKGSVIGVQIGCERTNCRKAQISPIYLVAFSRQVRSYFPLRKYKLWCVKRRLGWTDPPPLDLPGPSIQSCSLCSIPNQRVFC